MLVALNDALIQMRFSIQKRSFLELAILKMNDYKLNEEISILDRVEFLETALDNLQTELDNYKKSGKEVNVLTPIKETPKIIEEKEDNIFTPKQNVSENIEQNVIIQEPVKEVVKEEKLIDTSGEITIKDIENIINNASKTKKEVLTNIWKQISETYTNVFAVQMLVRGTIVAVSDDAFIIELQDVGFCNRLMQYENYVKIMDVFKDFNVSLNSFICVPAIIWSSIIQDYKRKYSKDNPKPTLDNIRIGVKKTIIPKNNIVELTEDEKIELKLKEHFNDDEIKIID